MIQIHLHLHDEEERRNSIVSLTDSEKFLARPRVGRDSPLQQGGARAGTPYNGRPFGKESSMPIGNRIFSSVSQRTFENLLIVVATVILFFYDIGSIPPKLHHFEGWVDPQLAIFRQGWGAFFQEYSKLGQNDTNAAVISPAWLIIIYISKIVFADDLLAHRVPSVLLTAPIPLIMAEIVRQFYRKDLALLAGLVTLGSQHLMLLGRIGGYVAPTTTLLMLIILFGMKIAWAGQRKAWIPFTVAILLMPMFYSTIRYMFLLPVAIIALEMFRSPTFRKKHWLPCVLSICAFAILMGCYVRTHYARSISGTLMDFIGARGEQQLLTTSTLQDATAQGPSVIARLYDRASSKITENLPKVPVVYQGGHRFFSWHYQAYEHTFHTWLARFFAVGFAVCAISAWRNPRYLFLIGWSLAGWFPLLFTTGLTNNRMLVSLPVDMFLLTLGPVFLGDLVLRMFGNKCRPVVQVVVFGLVLYFIAFSFYYFLYDCKRFCGA